MALLLRDASQRASGGEALAFASRCDAPQHEGEGVPRILAKRTQAGSMRASEGPTCGCTKFPPA